MALISRKKRPYPMSERLRGFLERHGRMKPLPVSFELLGRYSEAVTLYDKRGRDTLWQTVLYPQGLREEIGQALVETYATLKVSGRMRLMEHLVTDRVDLCTWGNTAPFRVRILNKINENFDYFYVKRADASRIYGLELEHLLSPNRIEFQCDGNTLVEEHIAGIPGDDFIAKWLDGQHLSEIRLAKEFVKFNVRCFVRLLGDMHAGNWVVDITPDFDETHYRIRAIDFDQQSHEGRLRVYLPQFYRQNNAIVFIGMRCMTKETYEQYRQEELTLIASRAAAEKDRLADLLDVMSGDELGTRANVASLASELAEHYDDGSFHDCQSMGDLVRASLALLPSHHALATMPMPRASRPRARP
ncbi:MAG: hypothetical protein FJ095_00140 [Deltaproteobacteria bacterium]|nr:hypothetical protein [Deltaproteobacteria bacterium]